MNTSSFETINISLPGELLQWVRVKAAQQDRTLSGMIRCLVAEAARLEPPPQRVLPNIEPNPAAIAAAKERLGTLRQRKDAIWRRMRSPNIEGAATDSTEYTVVSVEAEWLTKAIE